MLAEAVESVAAQTLKPAAHLVAVDHQLLGPGHLLNQLVRTADTEWISILADDDLYDPDHLETLYAETDDADVVLSWCRIEGRDEPQHRGKFSPFALVQRQDTGMRGTFMFRKSMWQELGGWPTGPMDDWQFMVNAATSHFRFVPVYRETWTYRRHGANLSDAVQQIADGETPANPYFLARHL